jgi:DUF1365 family protein
MKRTMNSFIYEGQVRHRRFAPRSHEFRYKLFMMYVDLDELPWLFDRFLLWSAGAFNLAWFRRGDHLGVSGTPLKAAVSDKIEAATGARPTGPIRVLTHFRYMGYGFNPVSLYYCFDEADERLETVVCEVNNTPWGEQHVYVLPVQESIGHGEHLRFRRSKAFHVSPFMPMDIDYDWRFSTPGERLNVHMENFRAGDKVFDATLALDRRPISSRTLTLVLVRHPMMTLKVIAAIYFEALRLWLKKTPFHPHPDPEEAPQKARG